MNTQTKHTPGPGVGADDGDVTLTIHAPKDEVDIARMSNDCEMFSEIRANAHIIAAAPAMYEALRLIKNQSIGDDWTAEQAIAWIKQCAKTTLAQARRIK